MTSTDFTKRITAYIALMFVFMISSTLWNLDRIQLDEDISSCGESSCLFIPLVNPQTPPEMDYPQCLWPHNQNQIQTISYKWGSALQSQNMPWRVAFNDGLNSWNFTSTQIWFYFDENSPNELTIYSQPDNRRGLTAVHCVNYYIVDFSSKGNQFYDTSYTLNQRRGIATHELGHGIGLGHIQHDYDETALMFDQTHISFFESFFIPLPPDIALTNQKYP